MSYLDTVKNLFNLRELRERRIGQLTREVKIDNSLEHLLGPKCPNIVLKYMFAVRKLNRYLADEGYKADISNSYNVARKNLETMDEKVFNKYPDELITTHVAMCEHVRKNTDAIEDFIRKDLSKKI